MPHLFPNFLTDESEYLQAEAFWANVWERTPALERRLCNWRSGWFKSQPPRDANPIFTAVSEVQKKGVRVIQYEPSSDGIELDFWMDSFGGPATDPHAIRELVIACALSKETAQISLNLMSAWIVGEIEIASPSGPSQGIATIHPTKPRWNEFVSDIDLDFFVPAA